uniref:PNPLA domain-containing protein n=1 Tax=Leptobrachium leishanense TaxID=445787 RepID=A0A8C5P763_9ANUR
MLGFKQNACCGSQTCHSVIAIQVPNALFEQFTCFNLIKNLRNALLLLLPDNAHQLATGRLYVALTRLADLKDLFVSDYKSKEEVVQVLICGCFLPFYCGIIPPSFRGMRYFDGACTNFHPFFSLHSVLTVSPFTGEIDICPRDCSISHLCLHALNASFQLSIQNLHRAIYSLFPPQTLVTWISGEFRPKWLNNSKKDIY